MLTKKVIRFEVDFQVIHPTTSHEQVGPLDTEGGKGEGDKPNDAGNANEAANGKKENKSETLLQRELQAPQWFGRPSGGVSLLRLNRILLHLQIDEEIA